MSSRATMWVGHATGRVLVMAAVLVLGLAVYLGSTGEAIASVLCVVAAALVSAFSRITVMIDRRGVTVLYSRLRWPRTVVALGDVVDAEPTELSPATWGGWGYRGSRTAIKRAAVLIRGGPGLLVTIADGTKLSVSVDDPESAVAALRELIGRRT